MLPPSRGMMLVRSPPFGLSADAPPISRLISCTVASFGTMVLKLPPDPCAVVVVDAVVQQLLLAGRDCREWQCAGRGKRRAADVLGLRRPRRE